jgi:Ca2+-binding RTX toxin-like protein
MTEQTVTYDRTITGDDDNTLVGDERDELLMGSMDDDTYYYYLGDGNDTIIDTGGQDTLVFGRAIGKYDLSVELSGNDLIITIDDDSTVTIEGWVIDTNKRIETVEYGRGRIANLGELLSSTDDVDTLTWTYSVFDIDGGGGNDTLIGGAFDDHLEGGTGNDRLEGGGGDDTYYYNLGDGDDTIVDTGGQDTVVFARNIEKDNLSVAQSGDNLIITIDGDGGDGQITIEGWVTDADNRIETIEFGRNRTANLGELLSATEGVDTLTWTYSVFNIDGLGGNDALTGGTFDDLITGGAGDDTLNGGGGSDTYKYNSGDGNDTITDTGGSSDKIVFGQGITLSHLGFSLSDNGNDLVITISDDNEAPEDNTITISGWNVEDNRIESLQFADGTSIGTGGIFTQSTSDDGDDLRWTSSPFIVNGLGGDDILTGGAFDDLITGGAGDDTLNGGGGSDTYNYNLGDGNDTITDTGGGGDKVVFGAGIDQDNLRFEMMGNNLVITISDDNNSTNNGRVTVNNWNVTSNRIESLQFADGTSIGTEGIFTQSTSDDGDDLTWLNLSPFVFDGGAGDDIIEGNRGDDHLYGGADDDELYGEAGEDHLYGGAGRDELEGGADDDHLYGGAGRDELEGGAGEDHLYGGADDDDLEGGAGEDHLYGGAGRDDLEGGEGNDTYYYNRGDGRDTIDDRGGNGDKLIFGEDIILSDLSFSMRGDDLRITIDDNSRTSIKIEDWEESGKQIEHVKLAINNRVLEAGEIHGFLANDGGNTLEWTLSSFIVDSGGGIDKLVGGAFDDRFTGGTDNDELYGGGGNDAYYYNLGDGYDTIADSGGMLDKIVFGEDITQDDLGFEMSGNNLIITINDGGIARGSITINGWNVASNRIETIEFSDNASSIGTGGIFTQTTNDEVNSLPPWSESSPFIVDGKGGGDTLTGGAGNDVLNGGAGGDTLRGNGGDDHLLGGDDIDTLYGGAGEDHLTGGGGNDILNGGVGEDHLYGGTGNDVLYGGGGEDTYYYNLGDGNDTITDSGGTIDKIVFGEGITPENLGKPVLSGSTLTIRIENGDTVNTLTINGWGVSSSQIERFEFADGRVLSAREIEGVLTTDGNDTITTWTASPLSIDGLGGDDTLTGGTFDDVIFGGAGNDTLTGGDGNDRLIGGSGVDTLTGGAGADQFTLYQGALQAEQNDRDIITDFTRGIDKIKVDSFGRADVTLDQLKASAQLRIAEEHATNPSTSNSITTLDTVIYNTRGTTNTADDVVLMVVEDTIGLTRDDFTKRAVDLSTLDGDNGFRLDGENADDRSGGSVSSAGDINNDGYDDIIIGATGADHNGNGSGSSYVVFGKAADEFDPSIDLSSFDGSNGFRLDGESEHDSSGSSVSGAGDVNGDGYDDLIIGAPWADPNGRSSGSSYVVFGKETSEFGDSIDLSSLDGSNGFRLDGESASDANGYSVSGAGDVNGDGYDDFIIGAWNLGIFLLGIESSIGSSYVVFGKASGFDASIDLSSLNGKNGFRFDGMDDRDWSGHSVSGVGDINGDGYDDIIIGAPWAAPNGSNSGSSYVVFGKARGFDARIDLSSLNGNNGFRLDGESRYDDSGHSVSGAGDINGDGYDDLIIGAHRANHNGSSYVVFGKANGFDARIDLSSLNGNNGFRLDSENAGDGSGWSVSAAGDFNGDGYDDLIIGARYADPNGLSSGSSYVVFGKADGFDASIDLSTLNGKNGFRLDGEGEGEYDRSGGSVSSAGDVNNDGYDDIIIGATGAAPNGEGSGSSYIVFGYATGLTIEGDAYVGEVLTATGLPDSAQFIWKRHLDDTIVETIGVGHQYTLTEDDIDKTFKVEARYTNLNGDVVELSTDHTAAIGKSFAVGRVDTTVTGGTVGQDRLIFAEGIDRNNLGNFRFSEDSNILTITISGDDTATSNTLTINDWRVPSSQIERFEFADGDSIEAGEIHGLLAGDGPNTLRWTLSPFIVDGGDSIDTLTGGAFDDHLTGGAGNDILKGGGGSDSYYYDLGDGHDAITDSGGFNDKVVFGAGIDQDDLSVVRSDNTLTVTISDDDTTGNILTINGWGVASSQIERFEFADGDSIGAGEIYGLSANDDVNTLRWTVSPFIVDGKGGADRLTGGAYKDHLTGGSGSDRLYGGDGHDHLIGGTGNDYLNGGTGSDTYYYNLGDGNDTIADYGYYDSYKDKIVFGAGIELKDLEIALSDNTLTITISDDDDTTTDNTITINNWSALGIIERFKFANGDSMGGGEIHGLLATSGVDTLRWWGLTSFIVDGKGGADTLTGDNGRDHITGGTGSDTLDGRGGSDHLFGGAGNDTLTGGYGYDHLTGGTGNDRLYGNDGNDHLTGGTGDDILNGGTGNNTYYYDLGDGHDTITDAHDYRHHYSSNDKIVFGEGIEQSDLEVNVSGSGSTLTISIPDDDSATTDKIITINHWNVENNRIEIFEFADGSSLTAAEMVLL